MKLTVLGDAVDVADDVGLGERAGLVGKDDEIELSGLTELESMKLLVLAVMAGLDNCGNTEPELDLELGLELGCHDVVEPEYDTFPDD